MPSGNVISDVAAAIRKAVVRREPSPTTGSHRWKTEILMAVVEVLARDGYGDDGWTLVQDMQKVCSEDPHVNLQTLSENCRKRLIEAEIPSGLTPQEAFDKWCNYEGLINYGPLVRKMWEDLQASVMF